MRFNGKTQEEVLAERQKQKYDRETLESQSIIKRGKDPYENVDELIDELTSQIRKILFREVTLEHKKK